LEQLRGTRSEPIPCAEAQRLADSLDPPTCAADQNIDGPRRRWRAFKKKSAEAADTSIVHRGCRRISRPNELKVRVLEQLAAADFNTNDLAASENIYEQRCRPASSFLAENHPMVSETSNNLGRRRLSTRR